mgnify:CR=1 FL=1
MSLGQVPLRSCVSCGLKACKEQLLRFVIKGPGEVSIDRTGKHPGRGAYFCNKPACWELGLKKNRLERALRTNISTDQKDRIAQELSVHG